MWHVIPRNIQKSSTKLHDTNLDSQLLVGSHASSLDFFVLLYLLYSAISKL